MRYKEFVREAKNFTIGLTNVYQLVSRQQLLNLLKRHPVLRGWVSRTGVTWVWDAYDMDHTSAQYEIPASVNIALIFSSKNAGMEEFSKADVENFRGKDFGDFYVSAACWEHPDCYEAARLISPVMRRILSKRHSHPSEDVLL